MSKKLEVPAPKTLVDLQREIDRLKEFARSMRAVEAERLAFLLRIEEAFRRRRGPHPKADDCPHAAYQQLLSDIANDGFVAACVAPASGGEDEGHG